MTRMFSILAGVYWLVTGLGLAALVGSYAGGVHPIGDSLAVGRSYLAGAGLGWFALGWAVGLASPLWLVLPLVVAMPLGWARMQAETPSGDRTLYQKNMLYRMADRDGFTAELLALKPDFVTLQEVSDKNQAVVQALTAHYPTHHHCAYSNRIGGVAVLSRWPEVPGTARCGLGTAAVQVTHPELGKLWLASIHLPWPWPFQQAGHLAQAEALLDSLDGPVLIGGDFNMVPWSHALFRVAKASGSTRAGKAHQTYRYTGKPKLTLPIDHVFLPKGWAAASEARPFFGSDHRGVLVRF